MQVYPKNTSEKLEFTAVCEQIARYCTGSLSRAAALNLKPATDHRIVNEWLDQAQAFLEIRENGLAFPEFRFFEIGKELGLLGVGGAILEGKQLNSLRDMTEVTLDLIRGVRKQADFPALQAMTHHLEPDDAVSKLISSVVDETGGVRSSASKELSTIRRNLDEVRKRSNKVFDGLLRKYRKLGWLREYTESVYHDRRVLAVVAEYKNKLEGIVHGSSESGNTTFIEPSEMVGLNNELAGTLHAEKKEEQRILKELTREVAQYKPMLVQYHDLLAEFDLLEAKTKLARVLNAVKPKVHENCEHLYIQDGYHPMLFQKNRSENLPTIPLELELTPENSILVISGPNAGGKSIALKTVGLLQMMLQSGLLIPVHESSEMPVFAQLLVDIGDDQSIQQQLSTYSSRLRKLKHFLQVADARSLILLDEFGTGSDPELGGAIAEAVLVHLLRHKPWGVITTHFGNIKIAAQNLDGLRNGCMLFNESTLEPLYELKLNTPGSSYTFEVARKIGMDLKVLELARTKVDQRKVKLDQLLVDMQQKFKELEFEREAVGSERKLLQQELARLAEEQEEIREFKASGEKSEFKRLVDLGKKYEGLIDFFIEGGSKKDVLARIEQAGSRKKQRLQKAAAKSPGRQSDKRRSGRGRKRNAQPVEVGDRVRLVGGKTAGTVEHIEGAKAIVVFGNMKMTVKTEQLILAVKKSSQ